MAASKLAQEQLEEEEEIMDLTDVGRKLLKITQCPVCLESVGRAAVQCARGHAICASCRQHLTTCPTCTQAFALESSIMVTQILEEVFGMCQYEEDGCKKVASGDHQEYCGFRPTDCKIVECVWQGCVNKLIDHIKSSHTGHYTNITNLDIDYPQSHTFSFFSPQFSFKVWNCYIFGNEIFWKFTTLNVEKQIFSVNFYHVTVGKPKKKFYGLQKFVDLYDSKITFTHCMPALSNDVNDETPKVTLGKSMILPYEELCRFFKVDTLSYQFRLISYDVPVFK